MQTSACRSGDFSQAPSRVNLNHLPGGDLLVFSIDTATVSFLTFAVRYRPMIRLLRRNFQMYIFETGSIQSFMETKTLLRIPLQMHIST